MLIFGATRHDLLLRKCRAPWGVCVALAVAGCGGSPAPNPDSSAQVEGVSLDSLRATITALIGEPLASSASQCRATAFGTKPCGGSWSYLVYSTDVTDSVKLADLVSLYNQREADLNRVEGRVSDCRAVVQPRISFSRGHCSLAP